MREQFTTLHQLHQQALPLLRPYLGEDELAAYANELKTRTADQRAVVMVYGVYNAGKSTLINALLGEERAATGDVPQTDRVDEYQIGEISLLDTPGIDAPIAHENITQAQLERSDAVVFMLSSDGVFEEAATFARIGDILRARKPLLIVINNKSGFKPESAEYTALREKFRSNLYDYFRDDEALLQQLDQVQDYLVNARSALNARLDGKQLLLERSQLPAVEKAIERLFRRSSGAQVAVSLAVQLNGLLERAIGVAESRCQSDQLAELRELIHAIEQSIHDLQLKAVNHARKGRANLENELYPILLNGGAQAEVGAVLGRWQQEQSAYFSAQFERSMKQLDTQADRVAQLIMSLPGFTGGAMAEQDGAGSGSGFARLFDSLIHSGLGQQFGQEQIASGIVEILKQGKDWFPELFKGIGPKTMSSIAGRLAPFVGPLIEVALSIWNYYQATAEAERQVEMERQHREAVRTRVSTLVDELLDSLSDGVEDALNDSLQALINALNAELRQLDRNDSEARAHIDAMRRLQQQLDASLIRPAY